MAILKIYQGHHCIEEEFTPPMLLAELLEQAGVEVGKPCGGRGRCGKCAVMLSGIVAEETEVEKRFGVHLSCQAVVNGDAEVIVPVPQTVSLIEGGSRRDIVPESGLNGRWGAAVDIGTTTLALLLYDLSTGRCAGSATMMNPQATTAADVIGRIDAAVKGKSEMLRRQIATAINALTVSACAELGIAAESVDSYVITGNTTMLYLLTGRDPACLGSAPFQADCLFGTTELVNGRLAYMPGCLHAFVGADTVCAILACEMMTQHETTLLCDVGTNGELALWHNGSLYVTSTAAGPAFEGAGISCGCNSIPGAIDRVCIDEGVKQCHTIGNGNAIGICGSGLVDAIAAMLQLGAVDETGYMEEDFHLRDGVYLTQADVRAVQLAKAATCAGIECLLSAAAVQAEAVSRVYLAGGFGCHLNVVNAVRIGLIPSELADKMCVVGNAALDGAAELLLKPEGRHDVANMQKRVQHISLDGNAEFAARYVEAMMFPEEDNA